MNHKKVLLRALLIAAFLLSFTSNSAAAAWSIETVDSAGNVGLDTSLALDSSGNAHISYRDGTNNDLKYATNASGTWVAQTVDSSGAVGLYNTSIALDSSGSAHISYYSNNDLKYATNASGSWVTQTVDTAAFVGYYTSIALDSSGAAHISYWDGMNSDLKYATNATGSWVTQTVDSAGDTGRRTSIALDSSGAAHISYYDYTNKDLRYATNASGTWVTVTVDAAGSVGEYASIALDNSDNSHISYFDRTNNNLKYATNSSGSWVPQTVDNTGNVGQFSSIALDSSGNAHISYINGSYLYLKYATNASGSWAIETVDDTEWVGEHSSIALDSSGSAHISYYNTTSDDLKYATNASIVKLTISKGDSPDPVAAGDNITYTITYGNIGTIDATSVLITDTVPAGTTFVSATGGGTESGGVVTWNIGTLTSGTTGQTVGFTVQTSGSLLATDVITNDTYSIDSAETDPVAGSSVTTDVNVAPVVTAGNDQTVSEGDTVNLDPATFTDGDAEDTHTAAIDWGDGSPADAGTVDQNADTVSGSHTYTDNGAYTVTVTVTDDNGASAGDTLLVTVNNADPVVDAGADQTVSEGDTVTLAPSTFTDAGSVDTHTATIDWGDGSPVDTGTVTEPASPGTVAGSHVYADDGSYTVTVTVSDDDGGSGSDTLTVTVNNVAPLVDAGPDQTVNEGDTVSLAPSTFTDAGSVDTHTATIDWGDGSPVDVGTVVSGTVNGSHVYADNGSYTVTVTVLDDDGGSGNDTLTVTVNNIAPLVNAGPDQTVNEGDTVNLASTFTDAGSGDTHTATIDWGDSTIDTVAVTESGGSGTVTGGHVYSTIGQYTVTVTVTDDDGASHSDSLVVDVLNNLPVVNAGPDQTVNEGDTVNVSATFTDADTSDTHTATIDWGDSTIDTVAVTESGGSGSLSGNHIYGDDGSYTVTVTVTDSENDSGTDTLLVTVNNVSPIVDAGADQTVDEGDTVNVSATFTDAGSADTHTATIDWGDGSPVDAGTVASGTATGSHIYADNGSYTVTVTVTDDDGGSTADTLLVTVNNVVPVVNAGADQTANEGDTVTVSATFSDPGSGDTHTGTVDWDDGTAPETGPVTPGTTDLSHVFAENGSYTVTVTVQDDDGGSGSDTLVVTVNNVAPVVDAGPDQTVNEGDTVSLAPATFTDAGSTDTHTANIDWGDSATDPGTVNQNAGTVFGSHIYATPGTYTVTVTVTDDDNGSGSDTLIVTVLRVELNILKSVSSGPVTPGENLTYTINYSNDGEVSVTNIVITDTVPANTTFVSASDGGLETDGVVTWNIASLAAGASGTVNLTVLVSDALSAGDAIGNTDYSVDSDQSPLLAGDPVYSCVPTAGSGDVNGDGIVNILDAIKVIRIALGLQ